jgi:hypothetical protein
VKQIVAIPIVAILVVGTGAFLLLRGGGQPRMDDQLAMLDRYCVDCHNDAEFTGGVSVESLSASGVLHDAAVWEGVLRKMRAGAMPPRDVDLRPEPPEVDWLIETVAAKLDKAFEMAPALPVSVLHRLNRTEYMNAIHDLLAVDVDASSFLPPDSVVEGFDNIADAMSVSPALLEGYLSASAEVASKAIGDPAMGPTAVTYRTKPDQSQNEHVPGAPLGTIGGLVVDHYFPVDGTYRFEPRLYRQILASVRGLEFPRALEVSIDKQRVHYAEFGGPEDQKRSNEDNAYAMADEIDARLAFEAPVSAGAHRVAVTFVRKPPAQTADLWQEFERELLDSNEDKGLPHLDQVDIVGPLDVTSVGDTPSRQRIFICYPEEEADEPYCATQILSRLARTAYRRPVDEREVGELMRYFEEGRSAGGFEDGIELALRRMISGPEFVFRAEVDPEGVEPGEIYEITDVELASRLSFFLWSSIPDEELLSLAIERRLLDGDEFDSQVERMLRDPRSSAFVENFTGQWLALRNLDGVVPDPEVYPDFDNNLRQAFVRETELLFGSIVHEDRSVLDILDADYTFVNARLARHYGIEGVYGNRFRRVEVTEPARRGILGHGSILTLTSVATRTSPVTRGKWVMENLLGLPAPTPPPNVPAIEASATGKPQTLREQLVRHRSDSVCAACHQVLDPFGFALERYDAVGRYRVEDRGLPIDTADTLFDGTPVDGVIELREFLMKRKYLFLQTLTQKLMTYALGRSIEPADMPVVRRILREAEEENYRFSSIIRGIVNSPSFRLRMASGEEADEARLSAVQ